jgi:hypothetical protein
VQTSPENAVVAQLRKAQEETNRRLDALLEAQNAANLWLARIVELLETQQQATAAAARQPVVYGTGAPLYLRQRDER